MNAILVKIFATALTLSQVTTRPEAVKTHFHPENDKQEVAQLLQAGCKHMIKTFDLEDINFDDLLTTAMEDPQALTGDIKALNGLNLKDVHTAYKQYCRNEQVADSPVRLDEVIGYYNQAVTDLPDHRKLKGIRLPESSLILDGSGRRFTEVYEEDNRRDWIPLADIPDHVQKAFVAAEDKRFFQHKGLDERGIIRAFMNNFKQSGRPQGGSTITQQVAKNLLVGDDITYDRKMREMIIASRLEQTLTKPEILEIYLNYVFLGRASWGIEMAARSYFGKSAKALTLAEAALLAAMTKGPNYYNPDRYWDRAYERLSYVLDRMREDGFITAEQMKAAQAQKLSFIPFESPRTRGGFYFVDQVVRDSKQLAAIPGLTKASYVVKTTIHPQLQRAAEAALQEGLARYELNSGRFQFLGPEKNLTAAIQQLQASGLAKPGMPPWQQALDGAHLPLYDVHWPTAVVLEKSRGKNKAEIVRVGLRDGRIVPLKIGSTAIRNRLQIHDVVYVHVVEDKKGPYAELRVRPAVQGAALVLENGTGRILAMAGGFSYALSQLNRATQAERQPGSTLKPLSYLAALTGGLQPNTLIWDAPITLPPIDKGPGAKPWTPKNYDGHAAGPITLRQALEHSKNFVTARLLDGAIASEPAQSLDFLCDIAKEMGLYEKCVRYYPFVLGAQPIRLPDLAAFYATIANEGFKPTPHVIESIERDGRTVYQHRLTTSVPMSFVDRVAFYQMKTMLQGVLERGTAQRIRHLSPYVGGKTGTTDRENDAWFVGFTNDVTIAVWVGYDNAAKQRTLGGGFTGSKVAVPIFETIVQSVWSQYTQKTALKPPSPEVQPYIVALPTDPRTGERLPVQPQSPGARTVFHEHFRLSGSSRQFADTQYKLLSREDVYRVSRYPQVDPEAEDRDLGFPVQPRYPQQPGYPQQPRYPQQPHYPQQAQPFPEFQFPWDFAPPGYNERYAQPPMTDDSERYVRRPRRVDPDYLWRRIY
ncbi:MAG: PBP1A family penicillin-binding protein [Pseudomonadota bacterium]|nr:PBP1A family penicillin-binding protein [Pseudomonadota bacterium]